MSDMGASGKAELEKIEHYCFGMETNARCFRPPQIRDAFAKLFTAVGTHPLARMVALDEQQGLYDDEAVPLSPNVRSSDAP